MQGPVMHMMGYDPFRETPGRRGSSPHARIGGHGAEGLTIRRMRRGGSTGATPAGGLPAFPDRLAEDRPESMADA